MAGIAVLYYSNKPEAVLDTVFSRKKECSGRGERLYHYDASSSPLFTRESLKSFAFSRAKTIRNPKSFRLLVEGREGKGEGEREGEREEKGEGVSGRSHKVWWTEEEIKAHMQEHPDEFAIVMHSPSVALKSYCQSEELPSARNKDALP